MKKGIILILVAILVIAALGISLYFTYFYINDCGDKECFYNNLAICKRSFFINENSNTILGYSIKGTSGNASCNVNVQLLQVKQGNAELLDLEGKEMLCSVPLGTATDPEKNLKDCHGILKEDIQELIIKRLHSQIVQNIGKIGDETTKLI